MSSVEQPNDPTPVVTSFLLRQSPEGEQILLVRRSQRVRTYQGAWAGVSGYLEAGVTPLEQAYTELREETGLDSSSVTLIRAGTPLLVEDGEHDLRWLVHPFLFTLPSGQDVQLDWEAQEMRWVRTDELGAYHTVPMLAEALAQVYPIPDMHSSPRLPTEADDHGHA
jgi:8-oxo-dGTP diphosphatase